MPEPEYLNHLLLLLLWLLLRLLLFLLCLCHLWILCWILFLHALLGGFLWILLS